MRRIVMFNRMTVDGHYARPDGGTDWFVPEPELDAGAADSGAAFDTFIFGRETYEMFASFWPHALDESARSPHGGRPLSPAQRAMATSLNERTKLVFSRTLKEATWANSRVIGEVDRSSIEQLKNGPGKNLLILGSGSLVAALTEQRLIDEYQIVLSPAVLGLGRPLFGGVSASLKLKLLEARAYPEGNVLLRYEPA